MSTHAWTSSTTLEQLAAWLRTCRRVVVLTHTKPDGDAVGSTIALVRTLNLTDTYAASRQGEPRSEAWYTGPRPSWLADVAGSTPHRVLKSEAEGGGPPAHTDPDAVIILDTGSWTQLDSLGDWVRKRHDRAALVDHHVQGDADVAPLRAIDTRMAAVCQSAAELCRLILGAPSLSKLPTEVATPLYLGLATDTGWFRHSNVNKAVFTTAGELIEAGAENVKLYQAVEQRETPGRLRLLSRALASLELEPLDHRGRKIAMMTLLKRDFAECGAEPGDSGGFVDFGQSMPDVQVTILFTEAADGPGVLTKVSMRSKPGEHAVDVNAASKTLGGGGHVRAAGARLAKPIGETKALALNAIRAQVPA